MNIINSNVTTEIINTRFNEINEHCCLISIQPIAKLDVSKIVKEIRLNPFQKNEKAIIFCEYDCFNKNNNTIQPPYDTLPEIDFYSGYDDLFIYTHQKGLLCVQKQPDGIFLIIDGTLEDGTNI